MFVTFYLPTSGDLNEGAIQFIPSGLIIAGILTVLGLITALSRVFDAVTDPLIASLSDRSKNDLYSMGSKLSQKIWLFNKLVWEPMNSEGFRKITYNAADQKNSELLAPLYADLPKDVPYVGTHVWPSQGAVHAGLTHVVNAIPDN